MSLQNYSYSYHSEQTSQLTELLRLSATFYNKPKFLPVSAKGIVCNASNDGLDNWNLFLVRLIIERYKKRSWHVYYFRKILERFDGD